MNQILSTGDNSKKKNEKNQKQKPNYNPMNYQYTGNSGNISSVIRVFGIMLIVFGICMIGGASYGLYNTMNQQTPAVNVQAKPVISVDKVQDNNKMLLLNATSEIGMKEVVYQWDNQEQVTLNGNGGKYIQKKIQIPTGTNNLTITATDIQGNENTYTEQYKLEGKTSLQAADNGKIQILYKGSIDEISYITYRWDEEDEQTVTQEQLREVEQNLQNGEMQDTETQETNEESSTNNQEDEESPHVIYEIEAIGGRHTLTVVVVDNENNTETYTQKTNGVSIPKIEISVNDEQSAFVISLTDDTELQEVIVTINNANYQNQKFGQKLTGKEFSFEIPLAQGDNTMEVELINSDGQSIKRDITFTKQ